MHIDLHFDLRADLIGCVVSLALVMAASMFTKWTEPLETRFIGALSNMMNNRRWFAFWLIGFPIWATTRSLIMGYIDWDTIVLTALWSWWPFAVENIVKVSQGAMLAAQSKTLAFLSEIVVEIKRQNDSAKERDDAASARDEALRLLVSKLLDRVEEGGEVHG